MEKLNYTTKTSNHIDYNDLDNYIQKVLGWKNYEFVAVEECGNSENKSFSIDGKLNEWDLINIKKWKRGQIVHYSNQAILNYLCSLSVLEPGEYLVEVFW